MNLVNVLFIGILILFPFANYFLVLAYINYRRTPLPVWGVWDAVGMLFAVSGFLLMGGPLILSGFRTGFQDLISGSLRSLFGFDGALWPFWMSVWLAYVVGLLGISAWLVLRRRHVTVIYNIDPAVLDLVLALVLNRLGLAWTRQVNRVGIGVARDAAKQELEPETAFTAEPGGGPVVVAASAAPAVPLTLPLNLAPAVLELDPFPAMRNVALRWRADDHGIRRDVEGELARALRDVNTEDNPSANWFLSFSGILFALMLFTMILTIFFMALSRNS